MTCPDIADILTPELAPSVAEHVSACEACGGVRALQELREAREHREADECRDTEVYVALARVGALSAASEGLMLEHVRACPSCNEVAARLMALGPQATENQETQLRAVPKSARRELSFGVFGAMAAGLLAGALAWSALSESPKEKVLVGLSHGLVASARNLAIRPEPAFSWLPGGGGSGVAPPGRHVRWPAAAPTLDPPANSSDGVGYFTLVCTPVCDKTWIGTKAKGPSPLVRVPVKPGRQVVKLQSGSRVKLLTVTIVAGQTTARRVTMTDASTLKAPQSVSSSTAVGYLTVLCSPTCDAVSVGSELLGKSPVVRAPLKPGPRMVLLRRGDVQKVKTVNIVAKQVTSIRVDMKDVKGSL